MGGNSSETSLQGNYDNNATCYMWLKILTCALICDWHTNGIDHIKVQ